MAWEDTGEAYGHTERPRVCYQPAGTFRWYPCEVFSLVETLPAGAASTAATPTLMPGAPQALAREPGGGPHLLFLGTGCAEPSKYRGASALHLRAAPGAGLLLDAGEGAWGALVRHYGRRGARRQVRHPMRPLPAPHPALLQYTSLPANRRTCASGRTAAANKRRWVGPLPGHARPHRCPCMLAGTPDRLC